MHDKVKRCKKHDTFETAPNLRHLKTDLVKPSQGNKGCLTLYPASTDKYDDVSIKWLVFARLLRKTTTYARPFAPENCDSTMGP